MSNELPQVQMPPWITGVCYISALMAGVTLIVAGHTTPVEATGYVAPFLLGYERVFAHRA